MGKAARATFGKSGGEPYCIKEGAGGLVQRLMKHEEKLYTATAGNGPSNGGDSLSNKVRRLRDTRRQSAHV